MDGKYTSTARTVPNGESATVAITSKAALQVALMDGASGSAVAFGYVPVEITTKTTTLVKSGPGMIGSITINTLGTADTITVYDALTATGTPIATIAAPLTVGLKFCEGYTFLVGCCVVTGGTTAGKYTVAVA